MKKLILIILVFCNLQVFSQGPGYHNSHANVARQSNTVVQSFAFDILIDGTNGNDGTGTGSLNAPYASIQKGLDVATPGDVIAVKAGVYREAITFKCNDVTLIPYDGESVEVTAFTLAGASTLDTGNKYYVSYSSFSRTKALIRVDGEYLDEASYSPNATKVNMYDQRLSQTWGIMDSNTGGATTNIGFTDDALIGAPISIGDVVLSLRNSWSITEALVTVFNSSTGSVTTDAATTQTYSGITGNHYAFVGSYNYLDAAGEFWKDEVNNRMYFICPDLGDPAGKTVELRTLDTLVYLNGMTGLTIEDLTFSGGQFSSGNGIDGCSFIGNRFEALDREFADGGNPLLSYQLVLHDNNLFKNNEVSLICRNFIELIGSNTDIFNNYFHDIGYANRDGAVIDIENTGPGNRISYNTFDYTSHSMIAGKSLYRGLIMFNDFSRGNLLSWDVGLIGFGNASYMNSIIWKNVFHDYGAMTAGVYMDSYNSDITIARNITYNSKLGGTQGWGLKVNLPSNNVRLFNNTSHWWGQIEGISATADYDASGDMIYNNASNYIIDADLLTGGADTASNIVVAYADSATTWTSPKDFDFTLLSTATNLIDKGIFIQGVTPTYVGTAPDVGALERFEVMWNYGHDFENEPDFNSLPTWWVVDGMNYIDDGSFEFPSLTDFWTIDAGSPFVKDFNTWNYKDFALAKNNSQALVIESGEQVSQTITGLKGNTTYQISFYARCLWGTQYRVAYSDVTKNFASATYSHLYNEYSVANMAVDDYFYIPSFDLGTGSALFDKVGISVNYGESVGYEIRLDSPTGSIIGSGTVTGTYLAWNVPEIDISAQTGTHDIYFVITSVSSTAARVDDIRFYNSALTSAEAITVKESAHSPTVSVYKYLFGSINLLNFTTDAGQTTATIQISKEAGGYLTGYVDVVSVIEQ